MVQYTCVIYLLGLGTMSGNWQYVLCMYYYCPFFVVVYAGMSTSNDGLLRAFYLCTKCGVWCSSLLSCRIRCLSSVVLKSLTSNSEVIASKVITSHQNIYGVQLHARARVRTRVERRHATVKRPYAQEYVNASSVCSFFSSFCSKNCVVGIYLRLLPSCFA